MDYPRDLLQIQVLDDSTDDTHPFAEALVDRYRALGFPIEYHHRTNRHGYKAGALQEGSEDRHRRVRRRLRRRFRSPRRFPEAHRRTTSPIRRSAWCRPAGAISTATTTCSPKSRRMLLDGHFVLEHGARCGGGLFLQLQRHGRHSAPRHDRRRRRLAARHAHRGFRPQLPRAAQGLALRLPARPGMPVGTARRNARLPGAAIALGQGPDAGRHEAAARDSASPIFRCRDQDRSVLPPDAQHLLPADDRGLGADAAGDDRALLHGLAGRCCSSICR